MCALLCTTGTLLALSWVGRLAAVKTKGSRQNTERPDAQEEGYNHAQELE